MASQGLVHGYAEGLFRVLQAEGELERVENELYHFGKTLESNHQLRQALSDQAIPRAKREELIEELLGGKASPHTVGLLSFVVAQGRGRQLPEILDELSDLAAEARQSAVAEVRTAVSLDEKQRDELAAALTKATGKNIEVRVVVDPSVIGGIVTKIGDTVIDGSVRARLDQLRQQVRGK
jgi:F-type H+-transporting ATPase subunit delta